MTDQPRAPKLHPILAALLAYEQAVYAHKPALATERLPALLDALSGDNQGRDVHGLFKENTGATVRRSFYTKVCAAIVAHLRSPGLDISHQQFCKLCRFKAPAETVFDLGGYHGAIALLEALSHQQADGSVQLPEWAGSILPLFFSLDEIPEALFQFVLQSPTEWRIPLAVGWLSAIGTALTKTGENRLVALQDALRDSYLLDGTTAMAILRPLTTAWMYCSYSDTPNKHEVKKALNAIWHAILAMENTTAKLPSRKTRDRPVLLLAAERMRPGHAMHRSYATCIEQLRQRFEVHLLVADMYYQAEGTAHMFDAVTVMPGASTTLREYAAEVVRKAPDMLLYTSLGMSTWSMALCNLRLAPVQLMLLGHPAPAMSEAIDYVLLQGSHESAADSFDAKVVVRRGNGIMTPPKKVLQPAPIRRRLATDMLDVAVNSSALKISARFVNACKRIQELSPHPLHFHFFTGAKGIRLESLRNRLESLFTHCTLHPQMAYEDFAATLSSCDLALSAFPFGNTNSTVDTCLLGIPLVAYYSPAEVLSMGDRDIMTAMGLPAWLLAHDDESYCQAALRLIGDDDLRLQVAEQLRAVDANAGFFVPTKDEDKHEFVDAIWWIHQNHAALKASSAHKFNVGEAIPAA